MSNASTTWTDTFKQRAGIAGGVGLVLLVLGAFIAGKDQFFRSYLIGYVFWLGIAFGCLGSSHGQKQDAGSAMDRRNHGRHSNL